MPQDSLHIAKSAGLISLATLISRVLGLAREQMIAVLFSRYATDAFYVAFRIPNLLRDLFAEGAMSSAFVPTFTEHLKKRTTAEAWKLASNVLNILLVTLSVITLLGFYSADWLVLQFAGEFRSVPGKLELTVVLTRIMFPFLPLVAIAAVIMGILNSQGNFFVPALAPALFNVGSLVVAPALYFWLSHLGYDPILGMAIGTLSGGLLQLLVQVPPLLRKGFVYSADLSFKHPGVRRILLLMGPGTIGLASTQINIFVNTWLATSEGEGPVSWLNYAFRLMQFPLGIFGVAIATAALPTVSSQAATDAVADLRRTLSAALRMVFLINIPATAGLIALSQPIVALIYQHGKFKLSDTIATSNALIFYALGLLAYSSIKVLVPAFYALGHSRVPVAISSVTVGINIALNLWLVRVMGYVGLALGTSLASFGNLILLLFWLQKYTGPVDPAGLARTFFKMVSASLVMGLACARLQAYLSLGETLPERFLNVAVSIGAGLLVLFLCCRLLRVGELETALRLLLRKVTQMSQRQAG